MSELDVTQLRPGKPAVCPACGQESVAKLARKMDGWTYVGQHLCCALCGAHWGNIPVVASDDGAAAERLEALAGLLGEELPEPPKALTPGSTIFCRDCLHFMRHPFRDRCLLHGTDVGPMDDCDRFEQRPLDQKSAEKDEKE